MGYDYIMLYLQHCIGSQDVGLLVPPYSVSESNFEMQGGS